MKFKMVEIAIEELKLKQNSLSIVLYLVSLAINGGAMVFSDPIRGTKRQPRCVHNGPGIRENAARIDNRYAKKQYHRAFKAITAASEANATAPGADAKEVEANDKPPGANAKEVKANDKLPGANAGAVEANAAAPLANAKDVKANDKLPMANAAASVAYALNPLQNCKSNVQNSLKLKEEKWRT